MRAKPFLLTSKSNNFRLGIMGKILDPLKSTQVISFLCYKEHLAYESSQNFDLISCSSFFLFDYFLCFSVGRCKQIGFFSALI